MSRFDTIEQQIKLLHDKFTDNLDTSQKRFQLLKDQLIKIEAVIQKEKGQVEILADAKHAELQKLQEKIAGLIADEIKVRKGAEDKLAGMIEERSYTVRQEINKEAEMKTEVVATLQNYLEVEIPQLYENLRSGVSEREQTEELLLRQISEEFQNIQGNITEEKKLREEYEEKMLEMLKEVINRVKDRLSIEKNERERTEETLVNLLEDTCSKINGASDF